MDKKKFISEYARWIEQGTAALFVGAGLSRSAGYPDWYQLLQDIAEELKIDLDQEHDLAGVAQWYINKNGKQKTRIAQVIKDSLPEKEEVPAPHRIMARLPIKHIWTTNYDKLIERAWTLQRRALDVKAIRSDLSVNNAWSDTTLYKMHGTVDHPAELVIATDDYELYRQSRAGFLQMLNGHLIGLHFLFLGFSFTDPNISRLFALIRESMGDNQTQHYAIVRKPKKGKGAKAAAQFAYAQSRHLHWVDDMQRYGINCVEVDEYDEIEEILRDLENTVAKRSVFVSGSYPDNVMNNERSYIEEVASKIGHILGEKKLRLVSGFGLTVGSAVMSGLLSQLYTQGIPSLEQSLFLRPFPQIIPSGFDKESFQKRYREDMIQHAGICIFIGGYKKVADKFDVAPGVIAEFEIAKSLGKKIIPVASTGGAAAEIWENLESLGGAKAAGISPKLFKKLGEKNLALDEIEKVLKEAIDSIVNEK